MWKKMLLILLAAGLLTGCGMSGGAGAKDAPNTEEEIVWHNKKIDSSVDRLHVSDGRLRDESGDQVQLRGVSTHGIGWYPEYLNAEAMQSVKDAGGNVIRIAMYTEEGSNSYINDPEQNLELVCSGIEDAKALGLYAIVDWHILSDGDPNKYLDEAIGFFDEVTSRYPDDLAILYEICNEPNHVSWDEIRKYAEKIFPVIRKNSPNAVILLGVPAYSHEIQAVVGDPFPGENFAYTYHFYAGEHGAFTTLKIAHDAGYPVFVSEWGAGMNGDGEQALEQAEEFLTWMNENGMSWCAWSLCNKDEVYSILRPEIETLGGWTDEELSDFGKLIFDSLQGVNE